MADDFTLKNAEPVGKLLRAIAGSARAKAAHQEPIFKAGAEVCEMHVLILKELEDVPGENALEKVRYIKGWYQGVRDELTRLRQGKAGGKK